MDDDSLNGSLKAMYFPMTIPIIVFICLYAAAFAYYTFDHNWCILFSTSYTGIPHSYPRIYELQEIDTLKKVINIYYNCKDGFRFYTTLQVSYSLVYYTMGKYYTYLLNAALIGQIYMIRRTYREVMWDDKWDEDRMRDEAKKDKEMKDKEMKDKEIKDEEIKDEGVQK